MLKIPWMYVVGVFAAVCGAGASAQANTVTPVTLQDLIDSGGSIQQGDKLFSNFSYAGTGDMPAASHINVIGIGTGVGTDYLGLEFQGAFSDAADPLDVSSDALIKYTVTVLDPRARITDAHLAGNLVGVGDPFTGHGSIVETFLPNTTAYLTNFNIDNASVKFTDSHVWGLPGYNSLNVQKDILLHATAGVITLSLVDQTFSQTVVPVPSAVWAGMSMLGGLGLLGALRRRRA